MWGKALRGKRSSVTGAEVGVKGNGLGHPSVRQPLKALWQPCRVLPWVQHQQGLGPKRPLLSKTAWFQQGVAHFHMNRRSNSENFILLCRYLETALITPPTTPHIYSLLKFWPSPTLLLETSTQSTQLKIVAYPFQTVLLWSTCSPDYPDTFCRLIVSSRSLSALWFNKCC